MPSQMPSSFAAAAGQASSFDLKSGGKTDSRSGSDWPRKEPKPAVNGTITLRRPSTNPQSHTPTPNEASTQTHQEPSVLQQFTHENSLKFRYSKKELLDIYKHQHELGLTHGDNVSHLFADRWAPGEFHGLNGRTGWGKSSDGKDSYAPDICWDFLGDTQPIGLEDMSEEEKHLFMTDINSPFKHQPQGLKDPIVNGQKSTFSHGQGPPSISNHHSPVTNRTSTRRPPQNDPSTAGTISPNSANRFSGDDQSTYFPRKYDHKDGIDERSEENRFSSIPPNGPLRQSNLGGTLNTGQISPWTGSSNNIMSPMGAFGNFALSSIATPAISDKKLTNSRSESRFFQSTPKDNIGDLPKSAERPWRSRRRTDTDPFADEPLSEEIAASGEINGQLNKREIPSFHDTLQHEQTHQHTPRAANEQAEPLSPSNTNPYRSPCVPSSSERKHLSNDPYDTDDYASDRVQGLGGILETGQDTYGIIPRAFPSATFDAGDRSHKSAVTSSRMMSQLGGLPSLGTIGGLSGWAAAAANGSPIGTTDHDIRSSFPSAFGNSIFNTMEDSMQLPGNNSLPTIFTSTANTSSSASIARGSKLGTLFPASLQAQMQANEVDIMGDSEPRQNVPYGIVPRNSITPSRDVDSPVRTTRHSCEDIYLPAESSRSTVTVPTPEISQLPTASSFKNISQQLHQQTQVLESSSKQQLPATQQRMMVMPDRMRWLYLDPQGQVQGPFSGLDMHDWYKASFFTPDLSVKKIEDTDFEPLGQLIRRIGNSREPFLVPQIGIPHGQPSTQAGSAFTPPAAGNGPGPSQPGVVQPPFANSFPSFGTTLTAEQQNNLERRKQEEQYLMARQREFLAQQQVNMKQIQMSGIPSVLHHSNLHGIQIQPSFGGIPSPVGVPQQPHLANGLGFFDVSARPFQNSLPSDLYREEEISRLSTRDRHGQQANNLFGQPESQNHAVKVEDIDFNARLQEFERLRGQTDAEESSLVNLNSHKPTESTATAQNTNVKLEEDFLPTKNDDKSEIPNPDPIKSTINSQNSTSTKQSRSNSPQNESPWAKFNTNLPTQFPALQLTSPNPPSSHKEHSNLQENSNITIKTQPKNKEGFNIQSIAPWMKDPIELPKPISIKETTEAEAKKAAKAGEVAAAIRRANADQALRSNIVGQSASAPPPGLPSTATWGSNSSPQSAPTKSVWAKTAIKSTISSSKQKTLVDIQKEEEARKQRLASASAAIQSPAAAYSNKRYADLASKAATATSTGGTAWFTVGAGGKVKVPNGPASPGQLPSTRSTSANNSTFPTRINSKPASAAPRTNTVASANNVATARDELTKWAKATLEKGLNPGINVNDFVAMLSSFPSELSIIADSIYSQSQTMNGNDFAMEFIRRRNNAEKGIIEPVNSSSGTNFSTSNDKSGGWSEVAKKGPPKEEPAIGFKIVPNKKKDKK